MEVGHRTGGKNVIGNRSGSGSYEKNESFGLGRSEVKIENFENRDERVKEEEDDGMILRELEEEIGNESNEDN